MRSLHYLVLLSLAAAAIFAPGCLEGIPFLGPPVVYPHIAPVPGGSMPSAPVYTFPFHDGTAVVDIGIDAPVYAGAKAADKGARIYDHGVAEEEWREGIYQALIGDPAQDGFYSSLIAALRAERESRRLDDDGYAELLAVFVQSIPYENRNLTSPRFPVETYVDGMGDCDDKSLLLAGLLSREGYRTALLYFDQERHMAVGVGSTGGGYRDTGYSYIETTNVSLICIPPGQLAGGVELTSVPAVYPVGNGTLGYSRCHETEEIWKAKAGAERELALMEPEIGSREGELDGMRVSLESERESMERLLSLGDTAGYNRRVAAYNGKAGEYNRLRTELLEMVNRYNHLAAIHNYIVTHQHDRPGTWSWLSSSGSAGPVQ